MEGINAQMSIPADNLKAFRDAARGYNFMKAFE
jgi:hypothetical protein